MALRSYKNIDIILWSIEIIMPVILLGYIGRSCATTVESALFSHNIVIFESTILPALFFLSMQRYFKIKTPIILKQILYVVALIHILLIWFGSFNGLYYKDIVLHLVENGTYFTAKDGPLKIFHYIYMIAITAGLTVTLVYGYRHPEKCTRKSVIKYTIVDVLALGGYLYQSIAKPAFEIVPLVYPLAAWLIALS